MNYFTYEYIGNCWKMIPENHTAHTHTFDIVFICHKFKAKINQEIQTNKMEQERINEGSNKYNNKNSTNQQQNQSTSNKTHTQLAIYYEWFVLNFIWDFMWLVLCLSWFIGCIQLQTLITFWERSRLNFFPASMQFTWIWSREKKNIRLVLLMLMLFHQSSRWHSHIPLDPYRHTIGVESTTKTGYYFILRCILDGASKDWSLLFLEGAGSISRFPLIQHCIFVSTGNFYAMCVVFFSQPTPVGWPWEGEKLNFEQNMLMEWKLCFLNHHFLWESVNIQECVIFILLGRKCLRAYEAEQFEWMSWNKAFKYTQM